MTARKWIILGVLVASVLTGVTSAQGPIDAQDVASPATVPITMIEILAPDDNTMALLDELDLTPEHQPDNGIVKLVVDETQLDELRGAGIRRFEAPRARSWCLGWLRKTSGLHYQMEQRRKGPLFWGDEQ